MPTPPNARSVKIDSDERGGWSSDRPRREGGPPRPADISVRCRVLRPSDALRYSPGSLLVIASASPAERDRFAERMIENKAALLSLDKVRGLLAGRVPDDEIDARGAELLDAAVRKRLEAGDTVVITTGLDPEERERYVRMAAPLRRPRHLILFEGKGDELSDEDKATLSALRRRVMAGEVGDEGFQTAMRLSGQSIADVRRIVFRPPPQDD
ncbi:MAG: AAA family ATPase [Thermoleophilaceae bacterium]